MERPILFSSEMVRTILSGHKTMTRRVVKLRFGICPYGQVGDRLWVRETIYGAKDICRYKADNSPVISMQHSAPILMQTGKVFPSMFMPRIYSRILLEITNIRIERLQEITEVEAEAEGCPTSIIQDQDITTEYPTDWFRKLWDSINGKKYPWSSNPWVWVISFIKLDKP